MLEEDRERGNLYSHVFLSGKGEGEEGRGGERRGGMIGRQE